jgi:hypothetical protein
MDIHLAEAADADVRHHTKEYQDQREAQREPDSDLEIAKPERSPKS